MLKNNIWAATPEVPNAYKPEWDLWAKEVERFDITPETIIVGHSCGGADFFSGFGIDSDLVSRTKGITIFNSTNDHFGIHDAVDEIRANVPGVEFPELRDHLLNPIVNQKVKYWIY